MNLWRRASLAGGTAKQVDDIRVPPAVAVTPSCLAGALVQIGATLSFPVTIADSWRSGLAEAQWWCSLRFGLTALAIRLFNRLAVS